MKKLLILKNCYFMPNGSKSKWPAKAGRVVVVSSKSAIEMIKDGTAELIGEKKKPRTAKKRKAPVNRKKKVDKTK